MTAGAAVPATAASPAMGVRAYLPSDSRSTSRRHGGVAWGALSDALPDPPLPTRSLERLRACLAPASAWLHRHETRLWWLHSAWALAFGIGVMWLGARNYAWLRATYGYVAFIWVASFALPRLLRSTRLASRWRRPLRLAVNYFVKNFYQQLLFFVLPVYWASSTPGSGNSFFVGLVAIAALLSTFDVVYDRHLSAKRILGATFFGFNLFVCVNVVLPVLWQVSNTTALRVSLGLAIVAMITLAVELPRVRDRSVLVGLAASAALLVVLVELGRWWIPPAPLRIVHAEFGDRIQRQPPVVTSRLDRIPDVAGTRLYVVTAISAPLGLRDRVRHVWSIDGERAFVSPPYQVTGGREEGYRLWTSLALTPATRPAVVQVDVETEGGQLIGRTRLVGSR